MNIHPIFVHFPIALLSLYAVAECVRIRPLVSSSTWRRVKQTLLLFGVLGAFAALGTGDFGEAEFRSARAVIGVHENFAGITTTIFSILLAFYIIDEAWARWGSLALARPYGAACAKAVSIVRKAFVPATLVVLALAGLVAVMVTGALGGAIVYGPDADPFVKAVYSIFF